MLRALGEHDRESVLAYLARDPAHNVFTIGDIENFGFDQPFQQVWGEFSDRGDYRGVVLRYFANYIVFSDAGEFDRTDVLAVLPRGPDKWILSGKGSIVDELAGRLGLATVNRQCLAQLTDIEATERALPHGVAFEWIGPERLDEVLALHATIAEFRALEGSSEVIRKNLESRTGRTIVARVDGRVVATASSAAESSRSAMVIGVCTAVDRRRGGLATACTMRLCRALLDEGKIVCLFYENPDAARIYKRLGFRDVGIWGMAWGSDHPA